jgi:hypothetical protein
MMNKSLTWVRKHWIISILFVIAVVAVAMTAERYQSANRNAPANQYSVEEAEE